MRYPTEMRMYVERKQNIFDEIYNDINNKIIVVNIKKSNREEESMLENEKITKLEQLNSLKGEYEVKLEELKAKDINSIIEEKVAEARAEIERNAVAENEAIIAKTEFKIEAIKDMIADVEAIEVEVPEIEISVEGNEEVPAEGVQEENQF